MSTSPGIRVLDVPKDASQRDIKVYFSNPRHGGAKIQKIYYPLQGNDAVVLFEDGKVNPKIFQQDHTLRGRNIRVRKLQRQVFSKVTVELGSEITTLLDNDPKYLDDIQYDGELEVSADDNYTITGDWYQVEWAWQYLDDVCNKRDDVDDNPILNGKDHEAVSFVQNDTLPSAIPVAANDDEDELPILQYPHHNELQNPSGFQPYCYENWEGESEYQLTSEGMYSRDRDNMNHLGFDQDFLARGLEFPSFGSNSGRRQTGYAVSHQDFQDLPLTYDFNISSLKISVLMNNLLQEKADAIVSSASGDLSAQFGISRVIARAADPKLRKECQEYVERHGPLSVGEVIHTSAGGSLDKKVGFVIHAIGPSWKEERSEESTHLLTCTYLNILHYANSHMWLQTIAMPLIGAGGVGFPLDVCVQALFDALLLFVMDEENLRHLQEVRIVSNDEDSTCATIVVFRSLLDVDQIATQAAAKDRYIRRSVEYDFKAKELSLDHDNEQKLDGSDDEEPSEDDENEKILYLRNNKSQLKNPDHEENEKEQILITSKVKTEFSEDVSSRSKPLDKHVSEMGVDEVKSSEVLKVEREDSLSSDESIPFGMIESDEEDTVSNTVCSGSLQHQTDENGDKTNGRPNMVSVNEAKTKSEVSDGYKLPKHTEDKSVSAFSSCKSTEEPQIVYQHISDMTNESETSKKDDGDGDNAVDFDFVKSRECSATFDNESASKIEDTTTGNVSRRMPVSDDLSSHKTTENTVRKSYQKNSEVSNQEDEATIEVLTELTEERKKEAVDDILERSTEEKLAPKKIHENLTASNDEPRVIIENEAKSVQMADDSTNDDFSLVENTSISE